MNHRQTRLLEDFVNARYCAYPSASDNTPLERSRLTYPQFHASQKVRTIYGATRTVLFQRASQVWVEEECNSWYHACKLFPVEGER